jgi:glyoxalase family protein
MSTPHRLALQTTGGAGEMPALLGLHHVSAISGSPQRNIDFYSGLLGLRLVKLTVNYDDPSSYHVYYGDGAGTPGTIITFFFLPRARRGRQGTGQAALTSFAIPRQALAYWVGRLVKHGVAYEGPTPRFGAQVLTLRDPDGLQLELVADGPPQAAISWPAAPVPAELAIQGLHGVTLWEDDPARTARHLEQLGFARLGEQEQVTRYGLGDALPGTLVDLRATPGFWRGTNGAGSVHHVAWRTPDEAQQRAWREQLGAAGLTVSPVRDRSYFQSIYFHEPGGALFEIATDGPGFAVDEPPEALGTRLMLPPQLEQYRESLAGALPELRLPGQAEQAQGWDALRELATRH